MTHGPSPNVGSAESLGLARSATSARGPAPPGHWAVVGPPSDCWAELASAPGKGRGEPRSCLQGQRVCEGGVRWEGGFFHGARLAPASHP